MYIKIKIKEEKNRLDFEDYYSPIVCGNSNYCLEFNFDEAWSACTSKTAIFVVDGKKAIVKFEGNTLPVPEMPNAPFLIVSLQGFVNEDCVLNTTGLKIAMQESPGLSDLSELEPLKVYFNRIIGAIDKVESGQIFVKEAEHAASATHAESADSATRAEAADTADSAARAEVADSAASAETAKTAQSAAHAKEADSAAEAEHAKSADQASHAASADRADSAGSSDTEVNLSSDQEIAGVKNFTGDLQVGGKSLKDLMQRSEDFVTTSGEQTISGDKTFSGSVVVGGTDLKQFMASTANSGGICNGNVLLNSNFKINQRGKSSYTGDVYTVDRWLGYQGLTVSVLSSGVGLSSASKGSSASENLFMQKFEEGFETFGGRTLTLSAKIGQELFVGTAKVEAEFSAAKDIISINLGKHGGSSDDLLKFKVDANKVFSVAFDIQNSSKFNVDYVKLEFGNLATEYCPPNPSEEILKCRRFYFQSQADYIFDYSRNTYYLLNNHIRFPVPMRSAPKISVFSYPMDEQGQITGDIIEGYYYNISRQIQGLSPVQAELASKEGVTLKEAEGKLNSGCLYSAGLRADAEI